MKSWDKKSDYDTRRQNYEKRVEIMRLLFKTMRLKSQIYDTSSPNFEIKIPS